MFDYNWKFEFNLNLKNLNLKKKYVYFFNVKHGDLALSYENIIRWWGIRDMRYSKRSNII